MNSLSVSIQAQEMTFEIDEGFNTELMLNRGYVSDLITLDDNKFLIMGNFLGVMDSDICCSATFFQNGNLHINIGVGGQQASRYKNSFLQFGSAIRRFNLSTIDYTFGFEYQKSAYNGFLGNVALDALVDGDDRILIAGRYFTDSIISNNTASLRQLCRVDSTGAPDPDFPTLHCAEPLNAQVFRIDTLSDGSYILSGSFYEFGGYDYNHVGKLNPDFSVDTAFVNSFGEGDLAVTIGVDSQDRIWMLLLTVGLIGSPDDYLHLIRMLPNGEIDPTFTPPVFYSQDFDGNTIQSGAADFLEMPDGRFILVGSMLEANGIPKKGIVMIEDDGTVVEDVFDNWGADEAVWGTYVRNPGISVIRALEDGKILLGGQFSSFGSEPYSCLVRLQPQTVSISNQINKNALKIYPNPATGHFILRMPDGEGHIVAVEIVDMDGRVLRQWTAPSGFGESYSVEGLSAGVYVVKVDTGDNRFSQKLIVRP